jgi:flagellar biogenesis protein FliO
MSLRAFHKSHTMRWTAGVLGVLGVAGFVLWLVQRVHAGHGLDPYRTGAGVEVNAVQVLATIVFLLFLFIAYRVLRLVRGRRW